MVSATPLSSQVEIRLGRATDHVRPGVHVETMIVSDRRTGGSRTRSFAPIRKLTRRWWRERAAFDALLLACCGGSRPAAM